MENDELGRIAEKNGDMLLELGHDPMENYILAMSTYFTQNLEDDCLRLAKKIEKYGDYLKEKGKDPNFSYSIAMAIYSKYGNTGEFSRVREKLPSKLESKIDKLVKIYEKQLEEARKIKENLSVKRAELKSNQERVDKAEQEFAILKQEIKAVADEAIKFNEKEFLEASQKLVEVQQELEKKEGEIRNFIQALSKIEAKKDSAKELKEKIQKVDICPECGQKVTQEHKKKIEEKANKEIKEADEKIQEIQKLKREKEQEKIKLEEQRQQMQKREKELRELKIKADSLKEKFQRKERIEKEKQEIEKKINELGEVIKELESLFEKSKEVEGNYNKKREEFEIAREKEKQLEIKKAGMEKLVENFTSQLKVLQEEINKKQKHKQDMLYLKELREWLSSSFSEILLKIEQSVLAVLHSQFDSLLKKWFSMLIEEPEIAIRLDADFSPIVEQAGYDTEYSHLSGGERTAVALAYRLALNQVINSLISQIKTKDLLILDEPTEGFSYSQLDKMRDIFQELNLKQLIIISHNPKIEGFVDNIIRVRKEGHVSRIYS